MSEREKKIAIEFTREDKEFIFIMQYIITIKFTRIISTFISFAIDWSLDIIRILIISITPCHSHHHRTHNAWLPRPPFSEDVFLTRLTLAARNVIESYLIAYSKQC